MALLKYRKISDESVVAYLKFLVGKVFKGLCMIEEKDTTLPVYIDSLIHQMSGFHRALVDENEKNAVLQMMFILEPFSDQKQVFKHEVSKREMFKCIDVLNKMISNKSIKNTNTKEES